MVAWRLRRYEGPVAMTSRFTPAQFPYFAQTDIALAILRMAHLLAEMEAEPDEEALNLLAKQVQVGVLTDTPPSELWPELVCGLMGPAPQKMIQLMRECGALAQILPEVAALFGVPQISDGPSDVDLGEHLLRALAEAARRDAPLTVRFALLVMNVGKADSPTEHLPVHYQHMVRGRPRIDALCERFQTPSACRNLAFLSLTECERVHRVSKVRAGPVALMLERLGAFDSTGSFQHLMMVCACDYCAYAGRSGQAYPKAALLDIALNACAGIEATGLPLDASATEAKQTARAEAIARVFRSQRWTDELA